MAPSKRWSCATLVVALGLLAACQGESPTEPAVSPHHLPANFRLTGSASSTESNGASIDCILDLRFELQGNPRQAPGVLEYDGIHGGSVRRTVLDAQGNGISLWPDVHGVVVVRSIAPNLVQIEIPANAQAESRFWRELWQLQGTFDSGGTAIGRWNCAPFDIDSGGYVDTMYTASGTWTLIPEP